MKNHIIDLIAKAKEEVVIIGVFPFITRKGQRLFFNSLNEQINNGIKLSIIFESDNSLFQKTLRTDTSYNTNIDRLSFSALEMRMQNFKHELADLKSKGFDIDLVFSTLLLSVNVVIIDSEYYYLPAGVFYEDYRRFERLEDTHLFYQMIRDYSSSLLDSNKDGRYSAKFGTELLELFSQDHVPRGIFPRDCFYNTDYYQYVIWDFVFSRNGELLIHKRADNAKDNQGMWDKSVGGHIDFNFERNSYEGAARELIEELYTNESKQQSGHEFSLLEADISKMRFLGEWKPDNFGKNYLDHVALLEKDAKEGEEPWVYYKLPGRAYEHETPRVMPKPESKGEGENKKENSEEDSEIKLRVLVDIFVFIANTRLTPKKLMEGEGGNKELKNSEFLLIEPSKLKTWSDNKKDFKGAEFKTTPDLNFILNSKYRDIIENIAELINFSNMRKYE